MRVFYKDAETLCLNKLLHKVRRTPLVQGTTATCTLLELLQISLEIEDFVTV